MMPGFWARIWLSPGRATVAGAVLSAVIASILYAFNWHTFYDTRGHMFGQQADEIADDLRQIALATGAAPGHDGAFRSALRPYIERRRPRLTVSRGPAASPAWSESNHAQLDDARTRIDQTLRLADAQRPEERLTLRFERDVRPSLGLSLARAWSFSLGDYLEDPERWRTHRYVNRSLPLYGYLLTVVLVGFGTIRALHRDQRALASLDEEATRVAQELDGLRRRRAAEIEQLRGRLGESEAQRGQAILERQRLEDEIKGVEEEYGLLRDGESAPAQRDERLRAIAERKGRIEHELASHDEKVARYERELSAVRGELGAAEELLSEVDARHEDLMKRLRDRNRRIRQLQELVSQAQRDAHQLELDSARGERRPEAGDRGQAALEALESQLRPWLETRGRAHVNFAQHSRSRVVEEHFARLDRDFVDAHFTHVGNREYERGPRRLIRVVTGPEGDGSEPRHGELIVALDDDAGRTLGLRFELKSDAPDVAHVGFVLALLLRAHGRDFRGFSIRMRA